QIVTWAKGTVRDPAGRAVAGASVWAVAVYHGGLRMYEKVKGVTTDAEGRYEIRGEGGLQMFSASVVGHMAGKPPAWAWLPESDPWGSAPEEAPSGSVDLVVPDRGGRLDVTVVKNG